MRTLLHRSLLVLLLVSAGDFSQAQAPSPRVLAGFAVHDTAGRALTTDALRMEGNWALVVLDPGLPSAQAVLSVLCAKETRWGEKITLLLLGDSPQALIEEIAANAKLANVRVLTAPDNSALQVLGLPGLPAMLGIRANQQIAWVRTGVPAEPAHIDAWLSRWTGGHPRASQ